MADLSTSQLLWEPLPDLLPSDAPRSPRPGRLFVGLKTALAAWRLSGQERVDRRVRRGAAQAIVREAYRTVLAEQDTQRRRPPAFAAAWKGHLAALLDRDELDLPGWGPLALAGVDAELAWGLYGLASRAREREIARAEATPSRPMRLPARQTSTFTFTVAAGDVSMGRVTYGLCSPCGVGVLYKISFSPDWQFCGFGRLALGQLEFRHPDLTWFTSGQYTQARGFYDAYRKGSKSPWTPEQRPCPHFD